MSNLVAFGPLVGSALFVVLAAAFVAASGMVRYIGNNRVAVVEKLWSRRGHEHRREHDEKRRTDQRSQRQEVRHLGSPMRPPGKR